jgi:hypothetical protein
MNHATAIDDVSYYRNQYRGDLIVTSGVLYCFPQTNVAAAKLEPKDRPTEQLGVVSHLFGLPGITFQLIVDSLFDVAGFVWRTLRITTNHLNCGNVDCGVTENPVLNCNDASTRILRRFVVNRWHLSDTNIHFPNQCDSIVRTFVI